MNLNHLAFVHIPKTGGSSIRKAYPQFKGPNTLKMGHAHGGLENIKEPYNVSFCVIREPFDWMFSLYHYSKYRSKKPWKELEQYNTYQDFILDNGFKHIKNKFKKDKQIDWAKPVNHILLFENLQKDFNWLLKKYNFPLNTLPKINGNSKHLQINEKNVDGSIYNLLKEHLEEDIEFYSTVSEIERNFK